MGLVTLNLSMVEMIMEGVVRKNSTIKRSKLMQVHLNHHFSPRTERFFLEKTKDKTKQQAFAVIKIHTIY